MPCVRYENSVLHQKAVADIYGNIVEQFRRNTVLWRLSGSFCALETTWKDEDVLYALFLFESDGRITFDKQFVSSGEVDYALQMCVLSASCDEEKLDAFEREETSANITYARLEYLRSSSESLLANSQNGANSGSAESGVARGVSS